jgi:uncharacterized protein (TIRG00374 family)
VRRTLWRTGKWLAGIGLSVGIVWLNWDKLLEAARGDFDWHLLLLAGFVCLAGVVLTFFRWYVLVRAQELPFRQVDALRLGFIGYLFSIVLPGTIGGDLVKAGFVAREQRRRTIAIATIIIDRVIGLFGLFLLAALVGLLYYQEIWGIGQLRWITLFVWAVAGGGVLFLGLLAVLPLRAEPLIRRFQGRSRFGRVLAELVRALQMYKHKAGVLVMATALALVGHMAFVLSFYFSALAVVPGDTPSLQAHYLIIPVGMVVQAVPLTPGNIGVSEGAFNELYRLVDPNLQVKGMLVSLSQRLVTWAVALIGLGFYLPLRRTVRLVMAETQLPPAADGPAAVPTAPVGMEEACDPA